MVRHPPPGTDILGHDPVAQNYSSLSYATGPGHRDQGWGEGAELGLGGKDYMYPATFYKDSAAHQGEEVSHHNTLTSYWNSPLG